MTTTKLYLIGTPLGNIEDITLRAQNCLRNLSHIFAEDTRELSKLLRLLGLSPEGKKLYSYAAHNMKAASRAALKLLETESVGLVTDRGMPAISDPGALLVEEARRNKIDVIPIPGPSAVTTLFSVSGFGSGQFHFLGFLPRERKERKKIWDHLRAWPIPACFFESPHRIHETLKEMAQEFPLGRAVLGREMTKQFEEYPVISLEHLNLKEIPERGEFTVFLDPGEIKHEVSWEELLTLRLRPDKEWAKHIAERYGSTASEVYNALQKMKSLVDKKK